PALGVRCQEPAVLVHDHRSGEPSVVLGKPAVSERLQHRGRLPPGEPPTYLSESEPWPDGRPPATGSPRRGLPATPTTTSRSSARRRPGTRRACRPTSRSLRSRWTTAGARRSWLASSPKVTT